MSWTLEKRHVLEGPPTGVDIDLLYADPPVYYKSDELVAEITKLWGSAAKVVFLTASDFHLSHEEYLPWTEDRIRSLSEPGDMIFDCFCGTSTTGIAAIANGRNYMGSDISRNALDKSRKRLEQWDREHA